MSEADTYRIETKCWNCERRQRVDVNKGITIKDDLTERRCEHCCCKTLKRID